MRREHDDAAMLCLVIAAWIVGLFTLLWLISGCSPNYEALGDMVGSTQWVAWVDCDGPTALSEGEVVEVDDGWECQVGRATSAQASVHCWRGDADVHIVGLSESGPGASTVQLGQCMVQLANR